MTTNKIDVEIVDDEGQVVAATEANSSEVRSFDTDASARLKELEDKYAEQSRRAADLEMQLNEVVRFAQGTVNENKRLNGLLTSGEKVLVDQAQGRVKAEMAAAENAFKKAYEEGDTEAMLKAQKAIADLTHQMKQVENFSTTAKPEIDSTVSPPAAVQSNQKPEADPKSKAWIEKNSSWFNKDKPMTGFAIGVHEELVRTGVKPGTDEYINALDARMAEAFPTRFKSADSAPRQRVVTGQTVAPATRSVGGKAVTKVQITPSMTAVARKLGVPVEAYAEELARMNQNG